MRGGRAAAAARERGTQRLAHLATQWRPSPVASLDVEPEHPSAPTSARHVWRRPALRGLALLVAVALALAGYGAWQGRPRAVAMAPTVLVTGVPVVGQPPPSPSSSMSPAPAEQRAAPPVGPSPAAPASPLPEVVVHVAGLVAHPGLVRLPQGSRVADAIERAGGVTRRAASDSVNLARILVDGEQIVVTATPAPPVAVGATGGSGSVGVPLVLDLNAATVEALDGLPGIGPVIAGRIVAWRAANGPFRSVDELAEVAGIGESILGQVRALVRV